MNVITTKPEQTTSLYSSNETDQYSLDQVDQFISEIDQTVKPQEVLNVLKRHLNELGFEKFSYQVIEKPSEKQREFYLSTYPPEWRKRYIQEKYIRFDPRGRFAMTTVRPFTWSEVSNMEYLTPTGRKIVNEGTEFGIRAGGIVPIHGPGSHRALLAVTSDLPSALFDKMFIFKRHVLQLIAQYAHEHLVKIGYHLNVPRNLKLSPREIEVLTWAAMGVSAEETGRKLSISAETIKTHIQHICEKLGTVNKMQAIAIAVHFDLIIP